MWDLHSDAHIGIHYRIMYGSVYMYIYVYVVCGYIYVFIYIYFGLLSICVCICRYIYVSGYVCVYPCVGVYIYVIGIYIYICVYISECVCVYIYICMSVCICMYMYVYVHHRLPMAEQVGCGTPCLLWSLGVREVVGSRPGRAIVRRVFHPNRKLVRFSLLKCPSIPNSKKFWNT